MRLAEIDLEIGDIEWYGIDNNGRIAQFTSGGSKAIPEFICESRERLDIVCDFFDHYNSNLVEEVIFNEEAPKYSSNEYYQECKKISQKGLYCFDIFNKKDIAGEYVLICKPSCELLITDLPKKVQSILLNYMLPNTDFRTNKIILVKNAY